MREALEVLACGLAAVNMSDAAIAALKAMLNNHEKQKSVRDNIGHYDEEKNLDFHFGIVEGSGNERLKQMLSGDFHYLLRVYRHKARHRPGRAAQVLEEHRAIVDALERRDPAAAESTMRAHLRHARRFVEEQLVLQGDAGQAEPAKQRTSHID